MTGLILKDFLILRKTARSYVVLAAFYAAMSAFGMMDLGFIGPFFQIMVVSLTLSCFALDDVGDFSVYAVALPTGRRGMVGARYVFAVAVTFAVFAVNCLAIVISSIAFGGGEDGEMIALVIVGMMGIFILSVLFPICYKIGVERARPAMMVMFLIPFLLVMGAAKFAPTALENALMSLDQYAESPVMFIAVVLLIAVAALGTSYRCSCKIVERKEF